MDTLFTDKKRDYLGIASPTESVFDFFDRSGADWAESVRLYLNKWIANYPSDDVGSLISRLKNREFDSAFHELFIHELFNRIGYQLEPHPELEHTSKRPEFRFSKNSEIGYIESKLVTEKTANEEAIEELKRNVKNRINERVKSNNFLISISDLYIKDRSQISSLNELCQNLQEYIDSKNPDIPIYENFGARTGTQKPYFEYDNDYLYIQISLLTKPAEMRSEGDSIIGLFNSGAKWMNTPEAIKSSIHKKATKYGQLNAPYIITLNMTESFTYSDIDIENALYGDQVQDFFTRAVERFSNGAFGTIENPKYTRVSGVLFSNAHYIRINKVKLNYYRNPFAEFPFSLTGVIDQIDFDGESTTMTNGKPISEYIDALAI